MALSTKLLARIIADATDAQDLSVTAAASLKHEVSDSWASGNGASEANQMYYDEGTVTANGRNNYDLAGVLTDWKGATITFTSIKALLIKNTDDTGVLQVGGGTDGAGAGAWDTWITSAAADGSESIILQPGCTLMLINPNANGYAVTSGSIDNLSLEETAGNDCTYELSLVGEEA